jgi:hypothetical protein
MGPNPVSDAIRKLAERLQTASPRLLARVAVRAEPLTNSSRYCLLTLPFASNRSNHWARSPQWDHWGIGRNGKCPPKCTCATQALRLNVGCAQDSVGFFLLIIGLLLSDKGKDRGAHQVQADHLDSPRQRNLGKRTVSFNLDRTLNFLRDLGGGPNTQPQPILA